ncbi:MAG TPA: hypothetical protein V6D18_10750 [Thermosynechococcaceae cyanobacterium]
MRNITKHWVGSLLGAVILLTAQAAIAETRTDQAGNVKAELSFERQEYGSKNFRLKILRAGQTVLNQPIPESDGFRLADYERKALQVRDLDGDREPEVIVDLFSGGAHCCTSSMIYRYQPQQKTYSFLEKNWRDIGYQLQDLDGDGISEFKSADASFAYAFASFAGSGFPLSIWQYRQGKLMDVTRRFPKLVYSDAYRYWKAYERIRSRGGEVKGVLAAYLADKYLLGQSEDGWQRVRAVYQEDDREQYFADLEKFLQERRYAR